jgi:hypothetical protein
VRRLKDLAEPETIARDPQWVENLERMNRDYIAPREIDVDWAEVMLVASCPDSLRETEQYVEELLATPGRNDRLLIVPLVDAPVTAWRSSRASPQSSRRRTKIKSVNTWVRFERERDVAASPSTILPSTR